MWCLAAIGEEGGAVAEQAARVRTVCDAYGWDDRVAVVDEIEARFRRALAHARDYRLDGAIRIWSATLDWLVGHNSELKKRL